MRLSAQTAQPARLVQHALSGWRSSHGWRIRRTPAHTGAHRRTPTYIVQRYELSLGPCSFPRSLPDSRGGRRPYSPNPTCFRMPPYEQSREAVPQSQARLSSASSALVVLYENREQCFSSKMLCGTLRSTSYMVGFPHLPVRAVLVVSFSCNQPLQGYPSKPKTLNPKPSLLGYQVVIRQMSETLATCWGTARSRGPGLGQT